MKKLPLIIATAATFSLSLNVLPSAEAATYTIKLTIIDEDASTNMALYDDEGDQSTKAGIKKCTSAKALWLNPNPVSTSDIIKYHKVGNQSKIKVKNDSGKTVGIGTLSKVGWIKDREEMDDDPEIGLKVYGTCTYSQSIKVTKSNFYSIEFSGTNSDISPFDISLSDLIKKKWKLVLTV